MIPSQTLELKLAKQVDDRADVGLTLVHGGHPAAISSNVSYFIAQRITDCASAYIPNERPAPFPSCNIIVRASASVNPLAGTAPNPGLKPKEFASLACSISTSWLSTSAVRAPWMGEGVVDADTDTHARSRVNAERWYHDMLSLNARTRRHRAMAVIARI